MPDELPQGFTLDSAPPAMGAPAAPAQNVQSSPQSMGSGLPAGFQLDDEKFGTPGQQAIAGLEGVARGATLGASDLAETKLLGVPAAEIKARKESNPVTSTLSQIGGGAGLLGVTGGLAAPVEGALGGGALARAAGFGLEGAGFGAGNAVSDAALGDSKLVGQKVLADAGMGAAFGAGLGLLSKGVEAMLPAATKKLTSSFSDLKESLFGTEEAPSLLTRVASVPGGVASGQNPTDWAQSFFDGMNQEKPAVSIRSLTKNLSEIHDAAKVAVNDLYEAAAPANISKSLEEMPLTTAVSNAREVLQKIAGAMDEQAPDGSVLSKLSPSNTNILNDRLETLEASVAKAKDSFQVHEALTDFAKDLDRGKLIKFDTMPTASQMAEQDILKEVRGAIRGSLEDESQWGEAAQHYQQLSQNYSEYKNALRNFQSSFMKKEVGPSGAKRFTVDPSKVQAFFNRFNDPTQDLRKGYLNEFLNKASNIADASENYYGYKAAESSISDRVSELAKKNQELTNVAEAMNSKVNGPSTAGRVGEVSAAFGAHSLGVPNPVIGAAIGAVEAYKAIKNPYQLGANLSNTFQKLKVLGDISDSVGSKITQLSKSIFTGSERAIPEGMSAAFSEKGYDKRIARIEALADSKTLMDHLGKTTNSLYEAAPNVSQGIQASIISGVQFLNSKIPRPVSEMALTSGWEPSRSQKYDFQRYYAAVDDPLSVLKEVKNGTLSGQSMEALQAVHSELLQEMRKSVLENLNLKKAKEMPYAVKISLSQFLGEPLDENMTPAAIAANQASFQGPQQSKQAPRKKQRTSLGGLKELDFAGRSATETQHLEDDSD